MRPVSEADSPRVPLPELGLAVGLVKKSGSKRGTSHSEHKQEGGSSRRTTSASRGVKGRTAIKNRASLERQIIKLKLSTVVLHVYT